MIQTIHRETLVETLLNSLEAERYMRGPLLLTVADELSAPGLEPAADVARALLARLEKSRMTDAEFRDAIRSLRQLVHSLAVPESGERMIGDPLRAVPRAVVSAASAA